jgi:hypothetical protein
MAKQIILGDMSVASDEQLQQNLRNMKNEVLQYQKNMTHHSTLSDTNRKRLELTSKMLDISCTANKKLEPTYEFEKDELWIKTQGELMRVNGDAELKNIRDEIERLDNIVINSKDEIERFDAAIPAVVEELKKRGVAE